MDARVALAVRALVLGVVAVAMRRRDALGGDVGDGAVNALAQALQREDGVHHRQVHRVAALGIDHQRGVVFRHARGRCAVRNPLGVVFVDSGAERVVRVGGVGVHAHQNRVVLTRHEQVRVHRVRAGGQLPRALKGRLGGISVARPRKRREQEAQRQRQKRAQHLPRQTTPPFQGKSSHRCHSLSTPFLSWVIVCQAPARAAGQRGRASARPIAKIGGERAPSRHLSPCVEGRADRSRPRTSPSATCGRVTSECPR